MLKIEIETPIIKKSTSSISLILLISLSSSVDTDILDQLTHPYRRRTNQIQRSPKRQVKYALAVLIWP